MVAFDLEKQETGSIFGAINESLSDIWGACVENYVNTNYGLKKDIWLHREELGAANRSLSNPNLYAQPNTYGGGQFWTGANADVHTNSGIMNYWFYLLSVGGSNTNGLGNAYNVAGIGIEKAAKIVYYAEINLMTSSTDFANARNATIAAAISFYGNDSPEEIDVTNAWHAVGVGNRHPPVISGPTFICPNGVATYTLYSVMDGPINWTYSGVDLKLLSYTANIATFQALGSIQNYTWIQANFPGGSVMRNDLFTINFPIPQQHPETFVPLNATMTLTPPSIDGITSYRWNVGTPSGSISNTYSYTLTIKFSQAGTYSILGYGINDCGESATATQVYIYTTNSTTGYSYASYPNPTSDLLNIDISEDAVPVESTQATSALLATDIETAGVPLLLADDTQSKAADPTFDIRLYNDMGSLLRQATAKKGGKVQFNVSNLPGGTYYLHIYDGVSAQPEKRQIIVKH